MSVYDFIKILKMDNVIFDIKYNIYDTFNSEDYKFFNEFCTYFELGKVYIDDFKWDLSKYDEELKKIDFNNIIINYNVNSTLDDIKSFIKQLIYFFKFYSHCIHIELVNINKFKFYNWINMDLNDVKYIMKTKLSNIKYELINMELEDNNRPLLYRANNVVFYYKNNKIKWFNWGG